MDMIATAQRSVSSLPKSRSRLSPSRTWDLESIYRDHAPQIWRFLARMGVGSDELDDALQDVFVIAHRKLSDFEGRSSLKTWIYGIALRIAKQCRQAKARQIRRESNESEIESILHGAQSGPDDPFAKCANQQSLEMIDHVLRNLSEIHREVFVLHEIEELSAFEISSLTETKLFTVYSRLRAARKLFDRELQALQGRSRG